MTLRECAIVTAYTGVAMLAGKDLGELYRYAEEITGISPVYTHYFADDDFNEKLHELSRTDFIELCKKASEPKGEPMNGNWISVEDRLPENETEVLIYCPEIVCTVRLAMWIEDGFYVDKEDLIIKARPNGYCTHWMPLPEPPKGE